MGGHNLASDPLEKHPLEGNVPNKLNLMPQLWRQTPQRASDYTMCRPTAKFDHYLDGKDKTHRTVFPFHICPESEPWSTQFQFSTFIIIIISCVGDCFYYEVQMKKKIKSAVKTTEQTQ
ncbi:hypothetical protein AMECASPLE_001754 [Ameca splendens]|uniref:Uncharacterized protein n=1 Tax=Ameca splendens TaxID=208324 RepID=A0ABV0YKG4_9TELE